MEKHRNAPHARGSTLIELMLYIGVSAIVLSALLSYTWFLTNDAIKQSQHATVAREQAFLLEKITYAGRRAQGIGASTVYGTHPGTLVFTYADGSTITFDTYTHAVSFGDSMVIVRTARMQRSGSPAVDLTSDRVQVTNLLFTNRSGGGATSVTMSTTLSTVNPSNDTTYAATRTQSTAVTLR